MDALGRAVRVITENVNAEFAETRMVLDIVGNTLQVIDARGNTAQENVFGMAGQMLQETSVDAGWRRAISDVVGNPLRGFSERGFTSRWRYDAGLRPTHQFVEASGTEILTTRTVYGESLANPEVLNLRGQAYRVYDGAGVQTAVAYDFKGGLLAAERQLGVDYTQTLDWSSLSEREDVTDLELAAASMLETEVFRTESTFDALGRPTTQTTPDGTVVRLAYNEAALLEGVSANVRGDASETAFVSNIDYDAKGRRTLIAYGNGTETSYAYDDITRRLTRLRTTDATRTFQDLAYTYDAVGNIVEIADAAQDDVYFGGAVVTARQRYAYDALYWLTNAEGREHAGQNAAQPTEFGASPSLHPQDGTAMRTYAEQYVYDVVGNILSMQHSAASGNWTRRYQYAANGNRLQANSAPGDAVGVFSHAYTHDAHGNMTSMPHLSTVTWNHADQMRSADLGGGGTAYFVYDGAGQRVRKVRVNLSGTQTYERIYLGAYELYRERTGGALQLERETLHIADDGGRMCDLEAFSSPQPLRCSARIQTARCCDGWARVDAVCPCLGCSTPTSAPRSLRVAASSSPTSTGSSFRARRSGSIPGPEACSSSKCRASASSRARPARTPRSRIASSSSRCGCFTCRFVRSASAPRSSSWATSDRGLAPISRSRASAGCLGSASAAERGSPLRRA